MTKAEQMLAKAGFPNTKAGRAAFHKMYPSPDDYFKVHGDIGTTPTEAFKKYGYLDKDNDASQEPDADVDDMMYKAGGSIHIKPSHKGRFTAYKKRTGKTTAEALHSKDPHVRQMANFAKNAAKWKHEDGGPIKINSLMTNDSSQYGNTINSYSTNTDDEGRSYQYMRQTTDPNKTPFIGYNYFPNLGAQLELAGPRGRRDYSTPDPFMQNFLNTRTNYMSGAMADDMKKAEGSTVDAYQLMGMPTPSMYGGGSKVHPTLTLSTEQNPNKASYLNSPYYQDVQSIDSRNILAGTLPISNAFNLTGSYSDANNGTYAAGAEYSLGDVLAGAGGKGPSRRYDNPDIAHKGSNSFLNTYGHLRAGVTNAGNKVVPYWGGDFTVAHQMGRVKGPNGLRQPKGTIYGNIELNNVEDPANNLFVNNDYGRANIGGSYNFGKGLGIYGEAGYDINRNSPRAEIGLKKTFADGGHITHYIPSYNFGHVQSANNTYRHGFANGGMINKYDFGSTIKDIGAGAYGALEGTLDTVTFGATDQLTDMGYKGLQKLGNSSEEEIRQQDSIHGYGQLAGAVGGGFANPAALGSAITEGSQGLGQGISKGSPNSKLAQDVGTYLPMAGSIAGMAVGAGAFGTPGSGASGMAQTAKFNASDLGKFASNASKTGQGFNAISSGNPMQIFNMFGGMGNTGGAPVTMNAMGGAVNAPNMMRYANGGMTPPPIDESMAGAPQGNGPTQINVERGELLVNKDGKILTEYKGGGMVPHPADGGMDERGTVPAQEGQFVITKRLAPNYKDAMKNNDELYASAMRNNIAFDKQRKEAKEQEAQQLMAQKASKAYGRFMAKYGGYVPKMDGGSGVPPGPIENGSGNSGYVYDFGADNSGYGNNMYDFDASTPFNFLNLGNYGNMGQIRTPYSATTLPFNQAPNAQMNPLSIGKFGNQPTTNIMPSVGAPNKNAFINSQVYGNNPNTSYGPWNARNAPTSSTPPAVPAQDLQDSQGPYGNRSYYDFPDTPDTPTNTPSSGEYAPVVNGQDDTSNPSWWSRNKGDMATLGGKALLYGPGIYNIARSFGKPFQMNAEDYMVNDRLKAEEEVYTPDYGAYNSAKYSLRNMPGAGPASMTTLYNAQQMQAAKEKGDIYSRNLGRRMQANQFNIGLEGQNKNLAMQIAQFNEQNKAAKRNMMGQGLSDLSQGYQFEKTNQLSNNALSSIMQHYNINPDGTITPKAYSPLNFGANTPTSTTNPSLASPNRYTNQGIDWTPTQLSFKRR